MGSRLPTLPVRRLAAVTALAGATTALAYVGVTASFGGPVLAVATLLAAATLAVGHRSVLAQVFARGTALMVFAPCVAACVAMSTRGRVPDLGVVALALSMGAALGLSRPFLHTDEARAQFAPVAYRRWFLAGAVTSVALGLGAFVDALLSLLWASTTHGLAATALGAALLASAVGVLKMRAWGVFLGVLTSVGTLLVAATARGAGELAVVAIPGLVLGAPLVLARLGIGAERRVRVDPVPLPKRVAPAPARVASRAEVAVEAWGEAWEDEHAQASPKRATR